MKVAVVGSRGFEPMIKVSAYIYRLAKREPETEIVSGGAPGVDSQAKHSAINNKLGYTEFPADWRGLGKRAGFSRNERIVEYADRVVAFWDGESRGTKHTIDLALKARKHLEVIFP